MLTTRCGLTFYAAPKVQTPLIAQLQHWGKRAYQCGIAAFFLFATWCALGDLAVYYNLA